MPAETIAEIQATGYDSDSARERTLRVTLIRWYQLFANEPQHGGSEHPFTLQTNVDGEADAMGIMGFEDEEAARTALNHAIKTFERNGWTVSRLT